MSTERRNPRSVDIDLFPIERMLKIVNAEDALVPAAVGAAIPEIAKVVEIAIETIRGGGRIVYAGAGSSGRIAVLDAAEWTSTFSAPPEWVKVLVAGGPKAVSQAVEGAEDDADKAAVDFRGRKVGPKDFVIGIAASGKTPYTLAVLELAKAKGARTAAVVAADASPMSKVADITIYTAVGPEIITGSTRMKAGTAQKLVLNMISTAAMTRLGMTYGNWMVNVNMSNAKLRQRGIQMLREILGVSLEEAKRLADRSGGRLKVAVVMATLQCGASEAVKRLEAGQWNLRKILGHLGSGRE